MPTYMIDRLVQLVRQNTDEPVADAKYTVADLLGRIEAAFQEILADLNCNRDDPLLVRHPVMLEEGSNLFLLPPNVEQIVRLAELDDTTGLPAWQMVPGSSARVGGPGFRVEGRMLRLDPNWLGATREVVLMYVPNGDFRLHYGTTVEVQEDSLVLAATPAQGERDTRENAYVGAVVRVIDGGRGLMQERFIRSYDWVSRRAAVEPGFDPVPPHESGYEVVPCWLRETERVVAFHVALDLLSISGNTTKHGLLERRYYQAMRTLRMQLSRKQNIVGDYFEHWTLHGAAYDRGQ